MAGYTRTRTDWTKDTIQGGSAHGERLFIRQHVRPEMMQYRDGQPWANGWIHEDTYRLDEGHNTGSAHGERLFTRQHIRPEMMQYRDGQPWANGWIHANTHGLRLDEGHNTGRSAPGEQPVTRQHVRPARTQHGKGEHLGNNFLIHEDTHVLVAHDEGRVSPWGIAGQTRTRTFWKKSTGRVRRWRIVGYASIRTSGD